MVCVDWICGKHDCRINMRVQNSFHYRLCKECSEKRKIKTCQTCAYGSEVNSNDYLCKIDGTYGLFN